MRVLIADKLSFSRDSCVIASPFDLHHLRREGQAQLPLRDDTVRAGAKGRGRRAAALEDVLRRGLASARPGGVRRRGGRLLAQGLAVEGAEHPQLPLRHAAMLARVRSCLG